VQASTPSVFFSGTVGLPIAVSARVALRRVQNRRRQRGGGHGDYDERGTIQSLTDLYGLCFTNWTPGPDTIAIPIQPQLLCYGHQYRTDTCQVCQWRWLPYRERKLEMNLVSGTPSGGATMMAVRYGHD